MYTNNLRHLTSAVLLSLILVMCTDKKENSSTITEEETTKDTIAQEGKLCIKGCYPAYKHDYFPIDSVKFDLLTHLTLCFAYPNEDGSLNTSQIHDIKHIAALCHQHDVQLILNIGGAADSEHFPAVAKDSILRKKFVKQLTDYVHHNTIDGVEIDWECWPTPETVDPEVSKAIVALFSELRTVLPSHKPLSYDVYSGDWYGKHYPTELITYADQIVIMAFTATGPWSETGHHSPTSLVEESYQYWIGRIGEENKGKVVFSTPFFGFNFMPNHKEGSDSTAFGIGYNDIVRTHPEAYLNDTVRTDTSVIYHNGIKTYKEKLDFVKKYDLKGISIWELEHDNVPEDKSLLKYVYEEINR